MLSENKQSIVISLYHDVTEIIQLAESFEYDVVDIFIQHRKNPNGNLKKLRFFLKIIMK